MDFDIPLSAGQSVLLVHVGPDGAETTEVLNYADKFRSCVGSVGTVHVAAASKLGTCI